MSNEDVATGYSYISSYAQRLLEEKKFINARIHSVFPNGFNIKYKDNLLFIGKNLNTLSTIGLAVKAVDFDDIKESLSVNNQVRIVNNMSESEDTLDVTFTFYTRPQVASFTDPAIQIVDLSIPHVSNEELQESQLLNLLEEATIWEQSGFATSTQLEELYDSFIQASPDSRPEAVKALIGAGIGLTPSGDDFLQGLMLFEHITISGTYLKALTQKLLKERSTTDISVAYYHALFEGYMNRHWIDLFDAVKVNDKQKMKETITRIQAYGHTSGNDTLLGVLTFLKQANWRKLWEKES